MSAIAAPVIVKPALAATTPVLPAIAPSRLVATPTKIERLWKKLQVLRDGDERLKKIVEKLDHEIECRMPAPHSSIVYSPENDADGLEWVAPPAEPASFIWPIYIERELSKVKYGLGREPTYGDVKLMERFGTAPPVLTPRSRRHCAIGSRPGSTIKAPYEKTRTTAKRSWLVENH